MNSKGKNLNWKPFSPFWLDLEEHDPRIRPDTAVVLTEEGGMPCVRPRSPGFIPVSCQHISSFLVLSARDSWARHHGTQGNIL